MTATWAVSPVLDDVLKEIPDSDRGNEPLEMNAIARHWVADVIYTPLETDLIKAARARGARAMGGAGMCIHQAAASFQIFTGLVADLARMQETFAEAAAARERSLDVS